jgi:hypothetical protein
MKNAISVCRILFFVAIIGIMTESAYSQKLKKDEQTPLPIPQDQQEFIQKIQAVMINKYLADGIANPIARKEAMEKSNNEFKKETDRLFESIKTDGLNDWVALCVFSDNNRLYLYIYILVQKPNLALGSQKSQNNKKPPAKNTLSERISICIQLEKTDDKIAPDVLDSIKKLTPGGFAKFTLDKHQYEYLSGGGGIYPSPSALKSIAPLK